jgi:phosphoserine phosphatase RsbU/P
MLSSANTILVAEDDAATRRMLEWNLKGWGFNVVSVADGEAAAAILESDDAPEIAIIDWMMPKIDGVEVCARVRRRAGRPYIYLVMLTARGQKQEIAAGLEAGADDYVVKPYDLAELHARLKVGRRVVALERALEKEVQDLQKALADVKRLKGLLPICMYCKSVRDDKAYWHEIEEYIHTEIGADFSHGICPACMAKLNAEFDAAKKPL